MNFTFARIERVCSQAAKTNVISLAANQAVVAGAAKNAIISRAAIDDDFSDDFVRVMEGIGHFVVTERANKAS